MSQALALKQAEPVKALFEYLPPFPLSHACIVMDELQQIPFWVGEVQRAMSRPDRSHRGASQLDLSVLRCSRLFKVLWKPVGSAQD